MNRDWAVHPGEVIRESMEEQGITQVALARQWGVSQPYVNRIVNCGEVVTARTALRVERSLGVSADLLVRMQADWDLFQARRQEIGHPLGH